ncbi:MAG: hypothetical protein JXA97_03750 [Anaerolineales bacterium]|nr:hypothetical protein [Anaerolineales bacterium]
MPIDAISPQKLRNARFWAALSAAGILVFTIGIAPQIIGMNRSLVIGFVQIGVWLVGLAMVLVGAFAIVRVVRNRRFMSLRADIGMRLIATGYVVSATASLADFVGVGAQRMPGISFGPLQVFGLVMGIFISVFGLFLYWPRVPKQDPKVGAEEYIEEEN